MTIEMTSCSIERRWSGDRGSGFVAGITLIFAFTFLGLVWLARDVDRSVSNRSTAQSVAFQAARSAAQAAFVPDLRAASGGPDGGINIDEEGARVAATATAQELFASYDVSGSVTSIVVASDSVTVSVSITDSGREVTGVGMVRSERGP